MLRKLEKELGAQLFDRTGRGVELTAAGRVFRQHALDAVRNAQAGARAVREVMGLQQGSIRVGGGATATTYLLPRVISAVRKAHPGLRFYVREAGSSAVAAAVLSGELDLGIVTLPVSGGQSEGLAHHPLVDDALRLILPPRHPLGEQQEFRWKELDGQSLVAFEAGTAVREVLDAAAARAGAKLNVVMELRSIESIKHMVAAGIGVGFVSRFALRPGEGLACRGGELSRKLAIVRRVDRAPSPAAVEFQRVLMNSAGPARN